MKIISDELSEYINTPAWNRPLVYCDDDDDEDYTIAITPVLSTEEPIPSLVNDVEYVEASLPILRPVSSSDFYHEEFADELAHIISPPEYDCFCFKIEPELGNLTMDVVGIFSKKSEPRIHVIMFCPPLKLDFIPLGLPDCGRLSVLSFIKSFHILSCSFGNPIS
ncbi:hypothetical protein Tco_0915593 [Tanacetum coccineum]